MSATTGPRILTDLEVRGDLEPLAAAWDDDATFAFVPSRSAAARSWIEASLDRLPAKWRAGHFALLTSGSTGRPKLVIGARDRAERLARKLHELQENDAASRTVLTLPLTYCYAFVNQWLWARVTGRAVVPTEGFTDLERLRAALTAADGVMLCMVGAQVPLLRNALPKAVVFPGVVRLHFAGGAFPQHALNFLRACFPNARIFNNYGCAEAMPRLTLRLASDADDGANIGRPLPGVELTTDQTERLRFRSPYGAVGFVDDHGVHPIGAGDWTATGDLGVRNPDGTWTLLGRTGEVFKRYGEKVSLPQLLDAVGSMWSGEIGSYRECDPNGEDGAVLVLAPAPAPGQMRGILSLLRERFPRAHWPLRIDAVAALPRLPSGKVDHVRLRELPGATIWRQRL